MASCQRRRGVVTCRCTAVAILMHLCHQTDLLESWKIAAQAACKPSYACHKSFCCAAPIVTVCHSACSAAVDILCYRLSLLTVGFQGCRLLTVTSGALWSYCCCSLVLITISKDVLALDVLLALDQAEYYRLCGGGGSPQLGSEMCPAPGLTCLPCNRP